MRILLRAFPAGFRRRYGDELLELVDARDTPLRDGANLVLAGLRVRLEGASAWMRGQTGFGRQFLSLGVAAAALGSAALGGCVILGSVAAGGAGALLAQRARGAITMGLARS